LLHIHPIIDTVYFILKASLNNQLKKERIAGLQVQFLTGDLPNMKQEYCPLDFNIDTR
jgi:hypothetical protein